MTLKVKRINAYRKNGKEFLAVKTEGGDTLFLNKGLISYAFQHVAEVKSVKANTDRVIVETKKESPKASSERKQYEF